MPDRIEQDGAIFVRELADGMEITVYRYLFNDRLCWGRVGAPTYERAFCFEQDGSALEAARTWDGKGDPPGPWIKEVGTERYGPGLEAIR